jgi:hypothetical protein
MPNLIDFHMAVLLEIIPRKRPMGFLAVELGSGCRKGKLIAST